MKNIQVKIPDIEWFRENIPCQNACPVHTDVSGYVGLIAQGRFDEAYALNRQANLFPEILGRICTRRCESACRLGRVGAPVSICFLKRAAADFADSKQRHRPQRPRRRETVAVVGAGPAGMAAAHDLAIMGYGVTVYEALPYVGGMLVVGIPAYRLPRPVVYDAVKELEDLGVDVRLNTPVGKDIGLEDLRRQYDVVLIAAGAHKPEKLGIPGEALDGVIHGVTFMRRVNIEPDFSLQGKRVVVIGGGHTAIDCVRSAVRIGASKVYMLYRRTAAEMTITAEEIEEAEEEGVEIQYLVAPVRVHTVDGRTVSSLECLRNELGEPDAGGRRRPVPIRGSEFTLQIDTLIPAVSQAPDTSFLPLEAGLEMSRWDRLAVDPTTFMSSVSGVFAVGDFITGPRDVIEVIADGRKAALSIDRYLSGAEKPQPRASLCGVGQSFGRSTEYDKIAKQRMPTLARELRNSLEREVELGYTPQQAMAEATRCLQCQYNIAIDGERCTLCNGCVDVCPHRLIKMVPLADVDGEEGLADLAEEDPSLEDAMVMALDEDKCIRCGLCVQRCPTKAISMTRFEMEDPDQRWYISRWRDGASIGSNVVVNPNGRSHK
ncbi:MAG: FAD-dependent oxidoreductase [Chloroflexi bacterium]|nr:FAD-dependent oxidoreductase [Chloroflexota bacterium]